MEKLNAEMLRSEIGALLQQPGEVLHFEG